MWLTSSGSGVARHAGDAGSSLYKTLRILPKTAVLSVGLLFCPFCLPSRARATPATKRCYLQCFVAFAFPGWLAGCSFLAAVSGASGARARDPMSAFWVGARLGPRKLASPASSGVGVHNLTSHIIAQDTFLIQKNDMTWHNFKEA